MRTMTALRRDEAVIAPAGAGASSFVPAGASDAAEAAAASRALPHLAQLDRVHSCWMAAGETRVSSAQLKGVNPGGDQYVALPAPRAPKSQRRRTAARR